MQFNVAQQEIVLKVVYYGAPQSGKISNLKQAHELLEPQHCGRVTALTTGEDRTFFFDLVPPLPANTQRFRIKVKLFATPGQVAHTATRRILFAGADGVVFVADSQRTAIKTNRAYWEGMQTALRETGLDPDTLPIVIQFNKRDLPDARTDEEFKELRQSAPAPIFPAVATRGEGVLETLYELLEILFEQLESRYSFRAKFNVSGDDFLDEVFGNVLVTNKPF